MQLRGLASRQASKQTDSKVRYLLGFLNVCYHNLEFFKVRYICSAFLVHRKHKYEIVRSLNMCFYVMIGFSTCYMYMLKQAQLQAVNCYVYTWLRDTILSLSIKISSKLLFQALKDVQGFYQKAAGHNLFFSSHSVKIISRLTRMSCCKQGSPSKKFWVQNNRFQMRFAHCL